MRKYLLEMRDIQKYIFDSSGRPIRGTDVLILNKVNFDLCSGEVNVLLGENGAGKSTLMRILAGEIPHDGGTITLDGQEISFHNPRESRAQGITFIHQELNLCTNLDVAHNIYLGKEPVKNGLFINEREMYQKSGELISSLGFDIDPATRLDRLSTAQQQIVEIAKALSYHSRILIMDEPTASLTSQEINQLFGLITDMRNKGMGIIFISHRMDEIERVADRVTVMRDGVTVGTLDRQEFTIPKAIHMMVGRELDQIYPTRKKELGEVVLEVKNFKIGANTKPINMHVRTGEIVGIGGLVGMGRTEFAQSIFGARGEHGGDVILKGEVFRNRTPQRCIDKGIAYLSEDRKKEGLVAKMTLRENISSASLQKSFSSLSISRSKEHVLAQEMIQKLNIVCQSMEQTVDTLSGGNQQRVCFAKWYATNPLALILDEPTRGVDVNAKSQIYQMIEEAARQGLAIIMISSEMNELIGMSDRIYIMRNGGIAAEITEQEEMTGQNLLKYTIGLEEKESAPAQ